MRTSGLHREACCMAPTREQYWHEVTSYAKSLPVKHPRGPLLRSAVQARGLHPSLPPKLLGTMWFLASKFHPCIKAPELSPPNSKNSNLI